MDVSGSLEDAKSMSHKDRLLTLTYDTVQKICPNSFHLLLPEATQVLLTLPPSLH